MSVILHAIPSLEGGGAERQCAMLVAAQVARGWTVHVALRRGGVFEGRIRDAGATIHRLGDLRGIHPLLVTRLRSLVRRLRPDIVQTWLPQMDVVGGIAACLTAVPWVLSERTSGDAYHDTPIVAKIRQRLAAHAEAIVANSADGARFWQGLLTPAERISTIPNAVDIAAISSTAPRRCEDFKINDSVLLFVGRLHPVKSPLVLVEAMRRLHSRFSINAVLIGDGPLREIVRATINEHRLQQKIRLLPYQADWWGLLKTATALVSTSRYEGQPNVVLESMAAGCPLIVNDIPAHRAILDELSAVFVPAEDPGALASAIESLISEPDAARGRAARAKDRVRDLTIAHAVVAYERVYARCGERRFQRATSS